MNVKIDIQHEDEDVVQFIKHLEENLDRDDEYSGIVSLETVAAADVNFDVVLDGENSNQDIDEFALRETGVEFEFAFTDGSSTNTVSFQKLIDSFYGKDSYVMYTEYSDNEERYYGYIFEKQ